MREGSRTIQLGRAVAAYRAGATAKESAREHKVSRAFLYRHLKFANLLRKGRSNYMPKMDVDLPLEEIWERARQIRESWTQEEAEKRWVGNGLVAKRLSRVLPAIRRLDAEAA